MNGMLIRSIQGISSYINLSANPLSLWQMTAAIAVCHHAATPGLSEVTFHFFDFLHKRFIGLCCAPSLHIFRYLFA